MNDLLLQYAPLPNIELCKNILVVGPHPDDIELGCGAFINKVKTLGAKVTYLICTDGGSGTLDKNVNSNDLTKLRNKESLEAASIMNIDKVIFLDFPDGGIYCLTEVKKEIAKVIISILPDLVLCPDPMLTTETHQDHLCCANATREALLIAQYPNSARRYGINIDDNTEMSKGVNLGYYYTNRENYFIEVSEEDCSKQIEAFMKHKSQIDNNVEMLLTYIKYKKIMNGQKIEKQYADSFYVLGSIHQHCFLEKL